MKNTPNRNTIEGFTAEIDEARFVGQYNFFFLLIRMLSLCLALINLFAQCCAPLFQLCDHGGTNTTLCREVGQTITGRRPSPGSLKNEALAFFPHNINLELDEEIMKPEKSTKAPRNSGIDPGPMKMKQ